MHTSADLTLFSNQATTSRLSGLVYRSGFTSPNSFSRSGTQQTRSVHPSHTNARNSLMTLGSSAVESNSAHLSHSHHQATIRRPDAPPPVPSHSYSQRQTSRRTPLPICPRNADGLFISPVQRGENPKLTSGAASEGENGFSSTSNSNSVESQTTEGGNREPPPPHNISRLHLKIADLPRILIPSNQPLERRTTRPLPRTPQATTQNRETTLSPTQVSDPVTSPGARVPVMPESNSRKGGGLRVVNVTKDDASSLRVAVKERDRDIHKRANQTLSNATSIGFDAVDDGLDRGVGPEEQSNEDTPDPFTHSYDWGIEGDSGSAPNSRSYGAFPRRSRTFAGPPGTAPIALPFRVLSITASENLPPLLNTAKQPRTLPKIPSPALLPSTAPATQNEYARHEKKRNSLPPPLPLSAQSIEIKAPTPVRPLLLDDSAFTHPRTPLITTPVMPLNLLRRRASNASSSLDHNFESGPSLSLAPRVMASFGGEEQPRSDLDPRMYAVPLRSDSIITGDSSGSSSEDEDEGGIHPVVRHERPMRERSVFESDDSDEDTSSRRRIKRVRQ